MMDDFDDDVPLVFNRPAKILKASQSDLEAKKCTSERHNGQSGKGACGVHSYTFHNSGFERVKPVQTPKATPGRSLANPEPSKPWPQQQKIDAKCDDSDDEFPLPKKSRSDDSEDDKPLSVRHLWMQKSPVTEEKQEIGFGAKSDVCEDDKPLSVRLSAVSLKRNSQHSNKGSNSSSLSLLQPQKPDAKCHDSDNELPLPKKFHSNATLSSTESIEHDDENSMVGKLRQNGSTVKDNQLKMLSADTNKRPLGGSKSSSPPPVKRPNLLDESLPSGGKQTSSKTELKSYDDVEDSVPISQRLKKPVSTGSKSSSVSGKVTKVVPIYEWHQGETEKKEQMSPDGEGWTEGEEAAAEDEEGADEEEEIVLEFEEEEAYEKEEEESDERLDGCEEQNLNPLSVSEQMVSPHTPSIPSSSSEPSDDEILSSAGLSRDELLSQSKAKSRVNKALTVQGFVGFVRSLKALREDSSDEVLADLISQAEDLSSWGFDTNRSLQQLEQFKVSREAAAIAAAEKEAKLQQAQVMEQKLAELRATVKVMQAEYEALRAFIAALPPGHVPLPDISSVFRKD